MADNEANGLFAVLQTATRHYHAVKDDQGLPEAFHEAGRGLTLVVSTLQSVQLFGGRALARDVSRDCNPNATTAMSMFQNVAQAPQTSRLEQYTAAVRQQGEGSRVEDLVMSMMRGLLCNLASHSAIKGEMESQVRALEVAMGKLKAMGPSVPSERSANMFSNYGPGSQFNAPGGTQNNNTGGGKMFSGNSFPGDVTFH